MAETEEGGKIEGTTEGTMLVVVPPTAPLATNVGVVCAASLLRWGSGLGNAAVVTEVNMTPGPSASTFALLACIESSPSSSTFSFTRVLEVEVKSLDSTASAVGSGLRT